MVCALSKVYVSAARAGDAGEDGGGEDGETLVHRLVSFFGRRELLGRVPRDRAGGRRAARANGVEQAHELPRVPLVEAAERELRRGRHRCVETGQQRERALARVAEHLAAVDGTALAADEPLRLEAVEQPRDAGARLDHARGDLECRQAVFAGAAQDAQHVVLLQRDVVPLEDARQLGAHVVRGAQQRHHRLVGVRGERPPLLDLVPNGAHVDLPGRQRTARYLTGQVKIRDESSNVRGRPRQGGRGGMGSGWRLADAASRRHVKDRLDPAAAHADEPVVQVRDHAGVVRQHAHALADAEALALGHGDDTVLLRELLDAAARGRAAGRSRRRCGRRGSLDSVLLPASRTARPGGGTLTTVATTVSAQSSRPQVPSATCEASWNT